MKYSKTIAGITIEIYFASYPHSVNAFVTSSVINLTGHKDEFLCRRLAENRCRETGKVVVCTGGVHMDYITGEQIEELLKNIDRMMTE